SGNATGPVLYNCVLENYAISPVRFDAYGTTTMYGHVQAGQSIFSRNWNGEGSSLLYFPNSVTNAGLIVVDSQFQPTSGTLRTDYTMTNTGIIELAGQGSRLFLGSLSNSGIFSVNAPTAFGSYGAVFANEGQMVLNAPLSAGPAAQTFRQISGRVENAHRLTFNAMFVRFEGGAFEPGAGQSLAPLIYDCVFSNETSAPISLDARGTTTFYGNIASGQIIRCAENPNGSNPYLYFPNSIFNAGEIVVTSDSNRNATLRTDYTLTNSGTIRIQSGGGGSRLCLGSLVNQGAYLIDAPTTFASYGATYTNRGQLTINPVHSLSIGDSAQTFVQERGTLNNASRLFMNSMTFVYAAYAYFPNSVINSGHLIVSSRNGAAPATLRTDYTLTNAAGGIVDFLPGTGGSRVFAGSLINQGLWSVQADTSAISYGAQFTNNGLFNVADGANFRFGGQPQTFNQAAPGIISGGRNIKGRSGALFQYLGGQFSGDGPELTDCVVAFSSDANNPIDLLLHGSTTFYGSILPSHKIASIATAGASAFLYFPNSITNQGQITLSTLDPDQSSRTRSDYTFINDGRLHLDPGGRVEGGTFIQHASGTTHFVLKGIEPSEFGRIAVSGTVTIDGTVTNQTVPGYSTYDQDYWNVISAPGGLVGTYATEALDSGFSFRYEGQRGRLVFL
ncbi:MAG: hypothetical protein NTV94_18890, partial [Planctomycetota bacterium]|nr:hypothetical protein [Planctomycetota bacterium]